jgi:cyclopropane fatty-acyl-phospholipid synthase-like methyltransferase
MAVNEQPTCEALEPEPARHPHDMDDADLARARTEAPRPDLLDELAAAGRAVFGFFPNHYPHTLNYPWMLERVEPLPPGARVLDVGAGVSPLPIVLARRGILVESVDKSSKVRTMPVRTDWNEWGFFDYSVVDARIQSYHRDVREHVPAQPYDRVYSVGALAHMTRAEREETVGLVSQWLKPGGRLLLAIDLLPKSDFLWNRSWGVEVEPPTEHGTVDDLLESIQRAGLRVTERRIRRTVYASRTDLLFVEAVARN